MNMANDGSLNRHGGQAAMESNADERARERAEAVEERGYEILAAVADERGFFVCPECEEGDNDSLRARIAHLRDCELLRARAEAEVDAAERAK